MKEKKVLVHTPCAVLPTGVPFLLIYGTMCNVPLSAKYVDVWFGPFLRVYSLRSLTLAEVGVLRPIFRHVYQKRKIDSLKMHSGFEG